MEEHHCFFIDIFNNLVDSNLSKVSTDSKANPEFFKPKRREMLYCKGNHICVHGSDYHFAKSLSCTMRNVEQNERICILMGTWLEILDIIHVILCGDDRFILCADDHLSASFASLFALEQIAKQFIFVSITPQESLPVRRNSIYSAYSVKLRGDIRKKQLLGILLKCSTSPGPSHMHNCSPVQYLGIYPRMNTC